MDWSAVRGFFFWRGVCFSTRPVFLEGPQPFTESLQFYFPTATAAATVVNGFVYL